MREALGSWLSGPGSVNPSTKNTYRGENLGLPAVGSGSIAGNGRRALALLVDWLACLSICFFIWGTHPMPSTQNLILWWICCTISVAALNRTPGQILCGIVVAGIRPGEAQHRIGFGRALIRQSLLLPLLIPAFFQDRDGRGLHDRATATAVLRA